ncbi:hypothetical protein Tco_1435037 [Tanacetum coccineum]
MHGYPQLPNRGPVLEIIDHRYEDTEQEKLRNRFPLVVLRDIDPQDYQVYHRSYYLYYQFTKALVLLKVLGMWTKTQRRATLSKVQGPRTTDNSNLQAPEPYVAPEGHHTSPEPEAAVTTHQDPAEYHGQGFEQGTSSENPDLPKPPTPHTPPTTISQQSIIETNIQMSSEQEPIDKEGAHKKLPKESTRKTLFGHQPEADPIQVPKKQKTDP